MFVRELTKEEMDIYSGAILSACAKIPAFRPALALMRPFYDYTASTAYTDRYSRVGLSAWFFEELDPSRRGTILLHEAFHIVNNTFLRQAKLERGVELGNYSSDLEINTGLADVDGLDMSDGILPGNGAFKSYPKYLTMEQYHKLLLEDPNFAKKDCPQCKGKGEISDESDDSKDTPSEDNQSGKEQGSDDSEGSSPNARAGESDSEENSNDKGSDQKPAQDSGGDQSDSDDTQDSGDGYGEAGSDGSSEDGVRGKRGTRPCPSCSGNGGDSGNEGMPCDPSTDARSSAADDIGIERASDVEISSAKENTLARIAEEIMRIRSENSRNMSKDSSLLSLLEATLKVARRNKVDWRKMLAKVIVRSEAEAIKGNTQVSYRRPSRRTAGKIMLPGTITFQPTIMIGLDTSGSMSIPDYTTAITEVNQIVKTTSRSRDGVKLFCIDTDVRNTKVVTDVNDIELKGGGGTCMELGWDFVSTLGRNRPSLFINITDGYINWDAVEDRVTKTRKEFASIMLVTTRDGFNSAPDSIKRKITVICIEEEK